MRRALTLFPALVVAALASLALAACSTAAPAVTAGAGSVAVITDSVGEKIAVDVKQALAQTVNVDAVAESGYLSASPGAVTDRVMSAPESTTVLVLALGAADVNSAAPEEIRNAAIGQALAAASARADRVVVLAPLTPRGTGAAEWRAALRDAAAQFGAAYIDADFPGVVWDQNQLTTAAAAAVAARIADAIR